MEWNPEWARFRTAEYLATSVLVLTDVAIVLWMPDPDPRWDGALPFDGKASTALRAGTGPARQRAQMWSDRIHELNFVIGLTEAPLAAGVAHGNWDVAWQLSLINAEAYAAAGFVQLLSARLVGRVRPFLDSCREAGERGEGEDFPCKEGGRTLSFLSGHAMTSFVSAGLMCAHHGRLPLWGSGAADASACVAMLASGTATGVLRVVADKHYASDVVLGMLLGFGFGYGIPMLFHYRSTAAPKSARAPAFVAWAPTPVIAPDRLGVAWGGIF
ncbi:MAG: phosphatase PAP2 family protein [Deltaproteobacteria bacterium]|nr:phosphatase PAP2 family protein [Deltaproteobacteria bacterium]